MLVNNGELSLLPTDCPVPLLCDHDTIGWQAPVIADTLRRRAYIVGVDKNNRHHFYALRIDYAQQPARLTLYRADQSFPDVGMSTPVLTPDGNLLMAGGLQNSNFTPKASAVLLLVAGRDDRLMSQGVASSADLEWLWWSLGILCMVVAVAVALRKCRNGAPRLCHSNTSEEHNAAYTADLVERIGQLMENSKLYLNSELKVADVAQKLGIKSRDVTNAIKTHYDSSFAKYVNGYRIRHAKQLLQGQPDMKLSAVCAESGFANETSFFRTFKEFTGVTPREWTSQLPNA